jgi:hypothetical protein
MVVGIATASRAQTPAASLIRVRGADPIVTAMIVEATRSSPTFRRLVAAIDRTDGLVYAVRGRCPDGIRACLPHALTIAGTNRLLTIVIDDRRLGIDAEAALGHELQHALEVLTDPTVQTSAAIYRLYDRHAMRVGNRFETADAVAAGVAVRAELTR